MRDHRTAPSTICQHCGTTFRPFSSSAGKFCSRLCANRTSQAARKLSPVPRNCISCGKSFVPKYPRPSRAHVYCSLGCINLGKTIPATERFERFVTKRDGCWPWAGHTDPDGYGVFNVIATKAGARQMRAHRFAWEQRSGKPIPVGLDILHTCDNPPCTRNDDEGVYVLDGVEYPRFGHLWLGTNTENTADRHRKGRDGSAPGSRNPFAKLDEATVRAIRADYIPGTITQPELARRYNISKKSVLNIVNRHSWRHLE